MPFTIEDIAGIVSISCAVTIIVGLIGTLIVNKFKDRVINPLALIFVATFFAGLTTAFFRVQKEAVYEALMEEQNYIEQDEIVEDYGQSTLGLPDQRENTSPDIIPDEINPNSIDKESEDQERNSFALGEQEEEKIPDGSDGIVATGPQEVVDLDPGINPLAEYDSEEELQDNSKNDQISAGKNNNQRQESISRIPVILAMGFALATIIWFVLKVFLIVSGEDEDDAKLAKEDSGGRHHEQ